MIDKQKLRALIQIIRPELTVGAGMCTVTGTVLALGAIPTIAIGLTGFLIVFLIAAFDMVENDVYDQEVDRVNAPKRPIPSGLISPRQAMVISGVCVVGSVLLSVMISWTVLALTLFLIVVGHLYNWKGKDDGLLGNMMVSISVGTGFIMGAVIVNRPFEPLVWAFALMGFLINLSLELIGDAVDREGDMLRGSRSLAITHGRETALNLSFVLLCLFTLASMIPYVFGSMGLEYLLVILPLDALVIFMGLKVLGDIDVHRIRNRVKTIYLSLTLAMVLIIIMRVTVPVITLT